MPSVSKEDLSRAIKKAYEMDIKAKERACNDLFIQQPNLLSSVVVQRQMGNTMNDVDSLLHILLVLYFALKEAGIRLFKISEQEQERQLEILKQSILFSEGMCSNLIENSIKQYISNNKEPILFAYVLAAMKEAGFLKKKNEASKYLIMAGLNLVSCIAETKNRAYRDRE